MRCPRAVPRLHVWRWWSELGFYVSLLGIWSLYRAGMLSITNGTMSQTIRPSSHLQELEAKNTHWKLSSQFYCIFKIPSCVWSSKALMLNELYFYFSSNAEQSTVKNDKVFIYFWDIVTWFFSCDNSNSLLKSLSLPKIIIDKSYQLLWLRNAHTVCHSYAILWWWGAQNCKKCFNKTFQIHWRTTTPNVFGLLLDWIPKILNSQS